MFLRFFSFRIRSIRSASYIANSLSLDRYLSSNLRLPSGPRSATSKSRSGNFSREPLTWWSWRGSNSRPFDCQSNVLPTELQPHSPKYNLAQKGMAGNGGEPHPSGNPKRLLRYYHRLLRDVYTMCAAVYALFRPLVLFLNQKSGGYSSCPPAC